MPSLSLCCMYSVKWLPRSLFESLQISQSPVLVGPLARPSSDEEDAEAGCRSRMPKPCCLAAFCREVNGFVSSGEAVQMSAMPSEQTDFLVGNKSSGPPRKKS